MKHHYLISAVLLLLSLQSHSQSTPLIPLNTIEKGFTEPDTLRAKLLDIGFKIKKSDANEENWELMTGDKYTPTIYCDMYSPSRNKIKSAIAIHIRTDKLPGCKKQYLQAIRKKYPFKHVSHVTEGVGTQAEKENFELEYYNKERYVSAKIQDVDDQWTIITFTIPEQFIR